MMPCNSQSRQIVTMGYSYSYTKLVNILLCTQEYLCGKPQNLYKLSLGIKGYLTHNGPRCHWTWYRHSQTNTRDQTHNGPRCHWTWYRHSQTNTRDQTHNALQHKYLGKTNQGTRRLNVKYTPTDSDLVLKSHQLWK